MVGLPGEPTLASTIVEVLRSVGGNVRVDAPEGIRIALDDRAQVQLRRRGMMIRNRHLIAANRATIPSTRARVGEVRAWLMRTRGAIDDRQRAHERKIIA